MEQEDIYKDFEPETESKDYDITTPFDPRQVDITVEPSTISRLVDRIKHDEIDLFPEFQRQGNLWDSSRMSQLIESILINLPLPAFYVDVADDDKWIVVDGLQRLSTFKKFIVDQDLRLKKLEFLKELEGKTFKDLNRILQRRIEETQVTLFKIRKGTPKKVLTSLFHRINTGGMQLTSQEIRHALNQGKATRFLKEVSANQWFKTTIQVSPKRMLDHELILRFCAFYRRGYRVYRPSLQIFLDEEMEYLNKQATTELLDNLKEALQRSLEVSNTLFGDKIFSKALAEENGIQRQMMNRSLFETTAVNIAYLTASYCRQLLAAKEGFIADYKQLMQDNQFNAAITANTNTVESVIRRHEAMQALISKHTGYAYENRNT